MGDFWDDPFGGIEDAVSDTVDAVGDVIEDVEEVVEDAASLGFGAVGDAWGAATGAAGDITGAIAEDVLAPVISAAVAPVADTMLSALDTSGFFEVVNYASVGLVDLGYENGNFSMDYGIEGVFGYSMDIGADGFSASYEAGGVNIGASFGNDGFEASGSAGWNYGPLPYVEGHGSVEADGDLGFGGEAQGYLPLPTGVAIGGEVIGDYQETDDGFRVSGSITEGQYSATGGYVGAGVHGSYEENADGYAANIGAHVEVAQAGGPTIRGSVDYNESRQGDVRSEGVSASGEVEYGGVTAGGTVGYQHTDTSQGSFDSVYGDGHVSGAGFDVEGGGQVTVGPGGDVSADGYLNSPDIPDLPDPRAEGLNALSNATGVPIPSADDVPSPPEPSDYLDDQGF